MLYNSASYFTQIMLDSSPGNNNLLAGWSLPHFWCTL